MRRIRKHLQKIAAIVLLGMITELIFPIGAYALTGGPSQPEVESFEPYGTTDMVDLFTGDFTYNIPLGDVGGYPLNLAYHGGVGMEQEASWVGLGWNLNPGVVNRNMRGLPDEFHGSNDYVKREFSVKPNVTFGLSSSFLGKGKSEYFGVGTSGSSGKLNLGIYYNNYKGIGYTADYSLSATNGKNTNAGVDISFNSQESSLRLSPNIQSGKFEMAFSYSGSRGIESAKIKQNLIGSTSKSFTANNSYVPFSNPNMYNVNFSLAFSAGTHNYGMYDSRLPIVGSYTQYGVRSDDKSRNIPAFGYMNSAEGYEDENAVMDFNRENENKPSKLCQTLGIPQFTYDDFSLSAQGMGGSFRAYLSSAATVGDPKQSNINVPSIDLGIEFGQGALIYNHYGLDLGMSIFWGKNDKWRTPSALNQRMLAQKKTQEGGFENSYFKMAGEKTAVDWDYYTALMREEWVFPKLKNVLTIDDNVTRRESETNPALGLAFPAETPVRAKRETRNAGIHTTLVKDQSWCFQPSITYWNWVDDNGKLSVLPSAIPRNDGDRKDNHITEVETKNPDGTRYIYGIPAYNWKQKEVLFAIDKDDTRNGRKRNAICQTKGLVRYNENDASLSNDMGIDNLYQNNELSPYPHSFLLTSVLSPDYLDRTGNGPTTDDYGNYTQLNYSLIASNYQWRTPYANNLSSSGNPLPGGAGRLVEGYISDPTDDKVSYIYGEKEYWILHSIETKTHVALFILSEREDALNAENEIGGVGTDKLKKLDKIIIMTRAEFEANSNDLMAATPVKVVHFEYDYSLCKNVPNNSGLVVDDPNNPGNNINQGGKLTLKRIWFTYGNNTKGKLNSYSFDYDAAVNYDYDPISQDGWGNYKPNACGYTSNNDLPYAEQNKEKADLYAAAWSLSEVNLPSGGKISINYEADDYAYVQDEKAMTMHSLVGFGETDNINDANNELYSKGIQKRSRRFLFFNIDQSIDTDEELQALFPIPKSGKMFYKVMVDLTGKGDYEYVTGYATVAGTNGTNTHMGLTSNPAGTKFGWIYVHQVDALDGYDINPISHAAFQMIRTELPHLVFPSADAMKSESKDLNILRGILSVLPKVYSTAVGMTNYMFTKNMARKAKLDGSSVIRLNADHGVKYGGGARVKEILFSDEWNAITGTENTSTTGIRYIYKTTEDETGLSSGVAAFEPPSILNECALYRPIDEYADVVFFKNSMVDETVVSGPSGKDYYPAPIVGYSRVEVRSLTPQEIYNDPSIQFKRHDNGYTVHEFYTAKEFPVQTILHEPEFIKTPKIAGALIKYITKVDVDVKAISQGFKIEVNDMHGKVKSTAEYSKLNPEKPIRRETIYYKVKDENAEAKTLDNHVSILHADGTISNPAESLVGEEVELLYDNNKNESFSFSGQIQINVDVLPIVVPPGAVIPFPIPSFYPSIGAYEYKRLNTTSTSKLIRKYGLVDRVKVENESASITSHNLAYDGVTGQVLLTKTETEYKDYLYNFDYPAYWAYDEMGPSTINDRYTFSVDIGAAVNGQAAVSKSLYNVMAEGDVVRYNETEKAWLLTKSIDKSPSNICDENEYEYQVVFIDEAGAILPAGNYSMEIMESGRKNMQALSMGNTVTLDDPLSNGTFGEEGDFGARVISSSALGYTNRRKLYEENYQFESQPLVTYKREIPLDLFFQAIYDFDSISSPISPQYNIDKIFDKLQPAGKFSAYNDALSLANASGWSSKLLLDLTDYYQPLCTCSLPDWSYFKWVPNIVSNDEVIFNIYPYYKLDTDIDDSPVQFHITKYQPTPGPIYDQTGVPSDITAGNTYAVNIGTPLSAGIFSTKHYQLVTPYPHRTASMVTLNAQNESTCWLIEYPFRNSSTIETCTSGTNGPLLTQYTGLRVNPYLKGLKTVYTADKSYGYYDIVEANNQRLITGTNGDLNLKESGFIQQYKPFYTPDCKAEGRFYAEGGANATGYYPWVETSASMLINPNGLVHESKDAKGINSATLYAYNQTLPIAMGVNAKYSELAFSNFEESFDVEAGKESYSLKWNMQIPYPYQEDLQGNLSTISDEYSHTGNSSLKVPEGGRVSAISDLVSPSLGGNYPNYTANVLEFVIGSDDLIRGFRPEEQETYTVSYWVKGETDGSELVLQSNIANPTKSYEFLMQKVIDNQLNPNCTQSSTNLMAGHFKAYFGETDNSFWDANALQQTSVKLAEIEGWVLRKVTFTVPSNMTHLKFTLNNSSGSAPIYVDDFRVFPTDGAMESYVFHSKNRRMMAKLDENNYATFYEYDEEGKLVRVKKETERGIITLSENRRNIRQN